MIAKLSWRELVALTLLLWSAWDPAHAQAVVPDPTLTPGVVRTTDATDVCSHGTNQLRHMSRERSDAIVAEYGLLGGHHPDFEIDHLIPLGIGDDDANLWPELRRSIASPYPATRLGDLAASAVRPERSRAGRAGHKFPAAPWP